MGTYPWDEDELAAEDRAADAREAAISFEAVKSAFRQTREGVALTLNLNPADVPPEMSNAHIGQRFMCVLVPLDDHEEPRNLSRKPIKSDGEMVMMKAGIVSNNEAFQVWLNEKGYADELGEEAAAEAIRKYCGISSRSELADSPSAARKFRKMYETFLEDTSP